jgi:hypothetical protein
LVNLANFQADVGELAAAMDRQHETIALLRETLGTDHPDTLICEANLAVTIRASGRGTEAEELRGRILSNFNRILGAGHPNAVQLRK